MHLQSFCNMKKYESLNGLRAFLAIGIVMMHVLANIAVKPSSNFATVKIIPYFTNFTLLFMIISAFSMCCGYYEKIKNGSISPGEFYKKRIIRIVPFFALMVIISVIMQHDYSAVCEGFANLTLCFNLLPNPDISIVGVGWFIGIIFTFYMLFPFFTFLIDNPQKGMVVLIVSLVFAYIAMDYFSQPQFVVRPVKQYNIIYCAPYFITGGLIYLLREKLSTAISKHTTAFLILSIVATVLRLAVKMPMVAGYYADLLLFAIWLVYAIGSHGVILNNKLVAYLSEISLEIYLCHMMFYRVVEKMGIERYIDNADALYIVSFLLTLAGAVIFAHVIKYVIFPRTIGRFLSRKSSSQPSDNSSSR